MTGSRHQDAYRRMLIEAVQDDMERNRRNGGGLRPCPFCGSTATRINWMPENTYIFCLDCYARGPRIFRSKRTEEAKDKAAERWNERDEGRLF